MISSAVVIPESEETPPRSGSTSPTLKRKLSHPTDLDRKRPKVDTNTDSLNYDEKQSSTPPVSVRGQTRVTATAAGPASPTQRRASALSSGSANEEKKRNQRLFGGLLGVVSGSIPRSAPTHRKRDEIEARARERQKKENEDLEAERRRRKDELSARRRKEQHVWDEESVRIRHQSMRNMAAFLRTESEPQLYYKPWELKPEEEAIIDRQTKEVEEQIRKELGKPALASNAEQVDDEVPPQNSDTLNGLPVDKLGGEANGHEPMAEGHQSPDDQHEQREQQQQHSIDQVSISLESKANGETIEPIPTNGIVDLHKDDDHPDGELVEGQEDDVIY